MADEDARAAESLLMEDIEEQSESKIETSTSRHQKIAFLAIAMLFVVAFTFRGAELQFLAGEVKMPSTMCARHVF